MIKIDNSFGVITHHNQARIDLVEKPAECPRSTVPIAKIGLGFGPVGTDASFVPQTAVLPLKEGENRFVPFGDGVKHVVIASILMLIVRRVEITEIRGMPGKEIRRIEGGNRAFVFPVV